MTSVTSARFSTINDSCGVFVVAGEPGECGEGGPQTGGQHDPPGRQPAPDQGGDGEPESGPRGHSTQKRYHNLWTSQSANRGEISCAKLG